MKTLALSKGDIIFLLGSLSNFYPFKDESVPKNIDPTFYQTLSYKGDKDLSDKYQDIKKRFYENTSNN